MSYTLPKHQPHAFAKARPWDQFKGKQIGRKEANRKEIFVPGHKENVAMEAGMTSSGAYGAFAGGPARAPAVETSRRQFGAHAQTKDDVLGPVDLQRERSAAAGGMGGEPARRPRKSKLEEPPPDTLRWAPGAQSGSPEASSRRRQVEARLLALQNSPPHPLGPPLAEGGPGADEARLAASAARVAARHRKDAAPPVDSLRGLATRPGKNENALRHEEQQLVRRMLEAEKSQYARRGGADLGSALGEHAHLVSGTQVDRTAALQDPRVQMALDAALNAPNKVAAEHNLRRNTTRASAERRW